jgi:hypothetical protein
MNTLNDKISYLDESNPFERKVDYIKNSFLSAKEFGYTMLSIGGYIYSIESYFQTKNSGANDDYFLRNFSLFSVLDLDQQVEPIKIVFNDKIAGPFNKDGLNKAELWEHVRIATNSGKPLIAFDDVVYSTKRLFDRICFTHQAELQVDILLYEQGVCYLEKLQEKEPVKPVTYASDYEAPVLFNKSFEALYNISMEMANQCVDYRKTVEARFEKAEEEYQELVEAFEAFRELYKDKDKGHSWAINDEVANHLMSETSDLLFVLFHIASKFKKTPFDLLHAAASKMLMRMNDPNYKAKR